jgi:hypothetical protein
MNKVMLSEVGFMAVICSIYGEIEGTTEMVALG